MNRNDAITYSMTSHDTPCVMISISTPSLCYTNRPKIRPHNKIQSILPLSFDDVDNPNEDDAMTNEDAERIAKFVMRHQDDNYIVHCDAGVSRSAGVSAAIAKYLTGSDDVIFGNPRFIPNRLCYRLTLNALMAQEK